MSSDSNITSNNSKKRKAGNDVLKEEWKSKIDQAQTMPEILDIRATLEDLEARSQAKLVRLKCETNDFTDGCLVKLLKSNEEQEQCINDNMCGRAVEAKFTAGPNAAPFFLNLEVKDWEGTEEIHVLSELFEFEKEEDDSEPEFRGPSEEEICDFLKKAGLLHAQTRLTQPKNGEREQQGELKDQERQRWVYAEVINEALELLYNKHDEEDNCGVGLGIGVDEIYSKLDLDY